MQGFNQRSRIDPVGERCRSRQPLVASPSAEVALRWLMVLVSMVLDEVDVIGNGIGLRRGVFYVVST